MYMADFKRFRYTKVMMKDFMVLVMVLMVLVFIILVGFLYIVEISYF